MEGACGHNVGGSIWNFHKSRITRITRGHGKQVQDNTGDKRGDTWVSFPLFPLLDVREGRAFTFRFFDIHLKKVFKTKKENGKKGEGELKEFVRRRSSYRRRRNMRLKIDRPKVETDRAALDKKNRKKKVKLLLIISHGKWWSPFWVTSFFKRENAI